MGLASLGGLAAVRATGADCCWPVPPPVTFLSGVAGAD